MRWKRSEDCFSFKCVRYVSTLLVGFTFYCQANNKYTLDISSIRIAGVIYIVINNCDFYLASTNVTDRTITKDLNSFYIQLVVKSRYAKGFREWYGISRVEGKCK